MAALGEDEFPPVKGPESSLNGAPGQTGLLRNLVVAEPCLLRSFARHTAPKEEIDDEGGGTVIVADEVAEEHVDDVAVEADESHKL